MSAGAWIALGSSFGVSGDIRRFSTFKDLTLSDCTGGKLTFSRASVGLTFKY